MGTHKLFVEGQIVKLLGFASRVQAALHSFLVVCLPACLFSVLFSVFTLKYKNLSYLFSCTKTGHGLDLALSPLCNTWQLPRSVHFHCTLGPSTGFHCTLLESVQIKWKAG